MITEFKIFDSKRLTKNVRIYKDDNLTFDDIIRSLGLDMCEDLNWKLKWKQSKKKIDFIDIGDVDFSQFDSRDLVKVIVKYFEWKWGKFNNKFQLFTSFFLEKSIKDPKKAFSQQ